MTVPICKLHIFCRFSKDLPPDQIREFVWVCIFIITDEEFENKFSFL